MTDAQVAAGEQAVRQLVNSAGYGWAISDEQCKEVAVAVLKAAMSVHTSPPTHTGTGALGG